MKTTKVALLLLLMVPALCIGQKKPKKAAVPELFGQARFVYVEAMDGSEFDRNLLPADRIAIADTRDFLKAWGRYVITVERDKAELIFVVRKGRLAEVGVNGGFDTGQDPQFPSAGQPGMGEPSNPGGMQNPNRQRQPRGSIGVGGSAGPEDDLLQVCQFNVNNGKRSSPLWIQTQAHGLDAPRVRLLAQFKNEVEKAYPAPLTTNSQGNGSTNGQANGPTNGQGSTPGKP